MTIPSAATVLRSRAARKILHRSELAPGGTPLEPRALLSTQEDSLARACALWQLVSSMPVYYCDYCDAEVRYDSVGTALCARTDRVYPLRFVAHPVPAAVRASYRVYVAASESA